MEQLSLELLTLPLSPSLLKPTPIYRKIHSSLQEFVQSLGPISNLMSHIGIPPHRFRGPVAVFSGKHEGFPVHFVYDKKRNESLEQDIFQRISHMTHLFPHKTHRCPILCLMYTHPRQLFPKLDIASHKRDAFFFSSSGVTNSNGIIVSKKNGLLGLLTHEMIHYLGQFQCYRDEGITDFIASMLEARFHTKDNTRETLLYHIRDQEAIARSRLETLGYYFNTISAKQLEEKAKHHGVATTMEYIMTRVMLHDHYIPGLFQALRQGTVPDYAESLRKNGRLPAIQYKNLKQPIRMEYYS